MRMGLHSGQRRGPGGPAANVLRRMSSNRTSRKRRKQRRAASAPPRPPATADAPPTSPDAPVASGGEQATRPSRYARSRAKDDAARAALKPLRPGERPGAVTVGAIFATVLAVANLVALAFGYNASEDTVSPGSDVTGSILTTLVVAVVAYGMWRAKYWGVLGMQTLLALTLVMSSLGLVLAESLWAALLLVLILAGAGTLFWFLVKAMARIQMPDRPSASRRPSQGGR
jgi:cation transport ATPase